MKRLRLSKALTIPDSTSIYDACRRMAARRVDALLLTDSNALLCGILTDKVNTQSFFSLSRLIDLLFIPLCNRVSFFPKDITTRVIASEVNIQETPVSKVMTKHPVFVLSDTLAVEALQKMVLGWCI